MIPRNAARLLLAAGLALSVTAPRLAHAQDDATIEVARQRFREGVQFYDQHQYEQARLAFRQAYALKPHPSVLLNLAQSELRSGHPDDAASHFSEYLRGNNEATDSEKQETELGFSAAKSKVAEVTVAVDASGAQVSLDGADKGRPLFRDPCTCSPARTLEARANDHHATKSLMAVAGQAITVSLNLHGVATAPPAAAAPAAAGGTELAETPEESEPEPRPTAEKPREESTEGTHPEPSSDHARPSFFTWFGETPVAWVGAGLGVLGLGGGVTFALLANKDYSNANTDKTDLLRAWNVGDPTTSPPTPADQPLFANEAGAAPCNLPPDAAQRFGAANKGGRLSAYQQTCKNYTDSSNAGDSKKTVAIVSTVVGGAALIGTVIYYFVDASSAKSSASATNDFHARLIPWSTPGSGGVTLLGQF